MWITVDNVLINLDHVARVEAEGEYVRLALAGGDSGVTVKCATPAEASTVVGSLSDLVQAIAQPGTVI